MHAHPKFYSPIRGKLGVPRAHEVGRLIGIELLDHIVIGEGGYVSFSESGLL